MIRQIALSYIFNIPIVVYIGIFTFLSFSMTAFIGITNYYHIKYHLPFFWHPTMVTVSFLLMTIHMFLLISIFMGY